MAAEDKKNTKPTESQPEKMPWEPMKLTYQGNVGDVLQQGGGKLATNSADSGDIYKPKGQG